MISCQGTLWYRFCRGIYRLYFRLYHRGSILHRDRMPAEGGVILAGNHVSFLDPPLYGAACRREAFFMARDTLFRNPVANWILRSWNCVPINRDRGDLGALRMVLRMLGEGKAVLMFPEGTRSKDGNLGEAKPGIGMIVAKSNATILPMRIFGADKAMPRGKSLPQPAKLTIVFGEPFRYPLPPDADKLRGDDLKALYLAIGQEIMRRIGELTTVK